MCLKKFELAIAGMTISLFATLPSLADSASETVLDGPVNRTGHYYSLDLRSGPIKGHGSQIAGAQWGSIYNDLFSVGLALNGLTSHVDAPSIYGKGDLSFYYYGIQSEYEAYNWSIFSVNAGAFAGLGHPGYRSPDTSSGNRGKYVDATVKVLECSAIATMNLSPRAKAGLGLVYRHVTNPRLKGLSGSSLSGTDFLLTLRSGTF